MKMQVSFGQALALAVGTALFVVGLSCKLGPVNYDKFEKRTIAENLAAVDSASSIYASLLGAGDIDAAAQQALAFLLPSPASTPASSRPTARSGRSSRAGFWPAPATSGVIRPAPVRPARSANRLSVFLTAARRATTRTTFCRTMPSSRAPRRRRMR